MLWLIVGMLIGAALPVGGFLLGYRFRQRQEKQAEPIKKRSRKPKCYVIEPKDFAEETSAEP